MEMEPVPLLLYFRFERCSTTPIAYGWFNPLVVSSDFSWVAETCILCIYMFITQILWYRMIPVCPRVARVWVKTTSTGLTNTQEPVMMPEAWSFVAPLLPYLVKPPTWRAPCPDRSSDCRGHANFDWMPCTKPTGRQLVPWEWKKPVESFDWLWSEFSTKCDSWVLTRFRYDSLWPVDVV